jgi:glucose repression regulatory protein TUP1
MRKKLCTNGASNPNPVPQQIPPQIGQHHSTLFSSVAPGGGPALPPQPTANNESQHGGYYNASMQPQQPYAKRPRVEGEPAPGPSNYTSQHISPPSGSNASTAQSIPKSQPTSQPTAVRRTPVEMETETNTIKHESGDWSVSFNPRTKQVLNVRLVHTLQHDTVVCCVNFSHDGKYLATGCNRTAQIFSVATGQRVDVLTDESVTREGDLYIRSVCFSPDGKYLATGAEDQRIRVSLHIYIYIYDIG